jgi:hypothetical protein
MPDDPNRKGNETGKPRASSARVWVLLGLTGLFFSIAIIATVLIVLKAFQNREIAVAKPVATPAQEASPPAAVQASSPTPESSNAEANLSATPETSNSPVEGPSSTPESGSPSPALSLADASPSENSSPSPAESSSGGSDIPLPSPSSRSTPPPPVANAQEEDATRKEVLKRIDMIRELSPKEKDYLYSQVERARGFTKLAIVPYGSGLLWPDSFQTNYLLENLSKPEIAKIFEDPTVVLVLAGYSDLKGSDERNLEISRSRAENLVKLLHRKAKITNLMRAVGMGGSDLFDKIHLEKNRVVEMWVVRP